MSITAIPIAGESHFKAITRDVTDLKLEAADARALLTVLSPLLVLVAMGVTKANADRYISPAVVDAMKAESEAKRRATYQAKGTRPGRKPTASSLRSLTATAARR